MASTPPRQGSVGMVPAAMDPSSGSNLPGQNFYSSGVSSPGFNPPAAGPGHYYGRAPAQTAPSGVQQPLRSEQVSGPQFPGQSPFGRGHPSAPPFSGSSTPPAGPGQYLSGAPGPPFSQLPKNAPPGGPFSPAPSFISRNIGPPPTAVPPPPSAHPNLVAPTSSGPYPPSQPQLVSAVLPSQTASSRPQISPPGLHPSSAGQSPPLQVRGPPSFRPPPVPPSSAPFHEPTSVTAGIPGQPISQTFAGGQPTFRPMEQPPPYPSSQYGSPGLPPYSQYGSSRPGGPPPSVASPYMDGQAVRSSVPYPGLAPPMGGVQGLVEEFQSLSMVSGPGSVDATVDPSALPRPSSVSDFPKSTWASNCHPRCLRLTCSSIPNSHSLVARWHLPLGAVVHPLAEAPPGEEVPVVNFGASGIVRCRRCRTYVNPYAVFTDGGRRWRCNVCGLLNEVPAEYFCPLDASGRRRDADERPELSRGSVELVAPTEYMIRPPMPPVYFFLIDVSLSAVRTGMLQIAVDTIKSCLDKLPGFPRTQIGFLTFDSALHFYNLKSSLTQPQMMVVADLDDPFVPMPDDLLVNLSESRTVVEALLDSLPSMFESNANIESAFGPALRAVFMVMSQLGGKLLVFQSTLPSLGVGRLRLRGDDPRIYGTDRECSVRVAEDPFYKQMAADFSKYQIGVNIYAFSEKYMDLASIGTLAKYTGGEVYYYPAFQPHLHREKFSHELARDLTRETAWEAVMRIRCGKGVRFNYFHGHFMLRSSDLMSLPAVDCDKVFSMELTLEDTLLTCQTVYFQVALLYTASVGERRIRVHTLAAPVATDLGELYRGADAGAIMSLMSSLAIEKSLVSKLEDARQSTQLRLVRSLREYRNLYGVQHPLTGRLIYPESLKLLPLYCLALCKSLALRGGYADAQPDERTAAGFEMMIMSIPRLLKFLYPTLIRLDEYLFKELKVGTNANPVQELPLTAERLDPRGAFLLDDGLRFILWLGKVLPSDFIIHLLGMEAANSADLSKVAVVEQNNDLSKRFIAFLKAIRENNLAVYQQCVMIRQGDQPREGTLVLLNLVEDRNAGSFGYIDWMVQIYRQVQQKG
eukprot:c27624_g1_i1 orf=387-3641(-)